MSDENTGLEDLKAESSFGERDDPDAENPYAETDDQDDDRDAIVDDLVGRLDATDRGDSYPSVGCRDQLFAAYFRHLDDDDERMEAVAAELADALGQAPPQDATKTTVMQLLFRIGLQEGAPEEFETLMDSKAEHARKSL